MMLGKIIKLLFNCENSIHQSAEDVKGEREDFLGVKSGGRNEELGISAEF